MIFMYVCMHVHAFRLNNLILFIIVVIYFDSLFQVQYKN